MKLNFGKKMFLKQTAKSNAAKTKRFRNSSLNINIVKKFFLFVFLKRKLGILIERQDFCFMDVKKEGER